MKKKITIISSIAFFVVLAVVLLIVLLGGSDEEVYRNIKIYTYEGSVSVVRNDKALDVRNDMSLRSNDDIKVGDDSSLIIKLDEDKFIYLQENSEISLVSSEKDASLTRIVLYEGTIITEVKEKLNNDVFDVETPNSVMSIRGTIVSTTVEEKEEETEVTHKLVEGNVDVTVIQPDGSSYEIGEFGLEDGNGVTITIDNNSLVPVANVNDIVTNNQVDSFDSFDEYLSVNGDVEVNETQLTDEERNDILEPTFNFQHSENTINTVSLSCQFKVEGKEGLYYSYEDKQSYNITVTKEDKEGYVFKHFLVNGKVVEQEELTMLVETKTLIEAIYEEDTSTDIENLSNLIITIEGVQQETPIIKVNDEEYDSSKQYLVGSSVEIEVTYPEGCTFIGWFIDNEKIESSTEVLVYEVLETNNIVAKFEVEIYDLIVLGGESGLEFIDGFASVDVGSDIDLSKIVVGEVNALGVVPLTNEQYIMDPSSIDFDVAGEYEIVITHKANPNISTVIVINVIAQTSQLNIILKTYGDVSTSNINVIMNDVSYGQGGSEYFSKNEEVTLKIEDTDEVAFLGWAYLEADVYTTISTEKEYVHVHSGVDTYIIALLGYKNITVKVNLPENSGSLNVSYLENEVENVTQSYEKVIKYNESISFEVITNEGITFKGWDDNLIGAVINDQVLTVTPDGKNDVLTYDVLLGYNYDDIMLDGTNTSFTEYLDNNINMGDEFDYSNLIIYGINNSLGIQQQIPLEEVEIKIYLEAEEVLEVDSVDTSVPGRYNFEFIYTNTDNTQLYAYAWIRVVFPAPEYYIEFGLNPSADDVSTGFRVVIDDVNELHSPTVPVRNGIKYQNPYDEEVYESDYFKGVGFDHNMDLGQYSEGSDYAYIKYNCYTDLITLNSDGSYTLNMAVTIPEGYKLYTGTNLYYENDEASYGSYTFTKVNASTSITDYLNWTLDGEEFYFNNKAIMFMVVHESIDEEMVNENLLWDRYNNLNKVYAITVSVDLSEFNVDFDQYLNKEEAVALVTTEEAGATGRYSEGVRNLGNLSSVDTYDGDIYNPHIAADGTITVVFENHLRKKVSYYTPTNEYVETTDVYIEMTLQASGYYTDLTSTLKVYRVFYYFECDDVAYVIASDLAYPGVCSDYGYNYCDDEVKNGETIYCPFHYYNEVTEAIFNFYFGEEGLFVQLPQ